MKLLLAKVLATAALAAVMVFGIGAPAGAQEPDLCALLGDPYCPAVGGVVIGRGGGTSPGSGGRGTLARTGSDVGPLIGVGAGLVIMGGAAAVAARRRGALSDA